MPREKIWWMSSHEKKSLLVEVTSTSREAVASSEEFSRAAPENLWPEADGMLAWRVDADLGEVMKKNSKAAQDRSDRVFLALYIKDHPMDARATVIGLGAMSFTLLLDDFGFEVRIFTCLGSRTIQ